MGVFIVLGIKKFKNIYIITYNMKKKRYLMPSTRIISACDFGNQIILTSIDQKNLMKVDPVEEVFYGGEKSETEDYLIKMY